MDDLIRVINSYIVIPNIEIEFRFGHLINNKYVNGISVFEYYRVYNYFSAKLKPTIVEYTTRIMANKYRYENNRYYIKEKKHSQILPDYPIKLAISEEKNVNITNFRTDSTRHKYRISFNFPDSRLDLTKVNYDKYEMELEIHNTVTDKLINQLFLIYRIMLDTEMLYTGAELAELERFLGNIRPIELIPLSNKNISKIVDNTTTYTLARNPDGLRYLLVIHPSGYWLYSANQVNRLNQLNDKLYNGYILDGFLVKHAKSKYFFVVMDCISAPILAQYGYDVNTYVKKYNHRIRMDFAQTLVDHINELELRNITVVTLKFREFLTSDQLFTQVRLMLNEQPAVTYPTNGLIMLPENNYTNPIVWLIKPYLILTYNNNALYAKDVEFNGTRGYPLNYRYDKPDIANIPVEYHWDNENNKLKFIRYRSDLFESHHITSARVIWEEYMMKNLFPIDVMRGDKLALLNRYKTTIFIRLLKPAKPISTLLDLSGWRDIKYLIALNNLTNIKVNIYEPDINKREDLRVKIKDANLKLTVIDKISKHDMYIISDESPRIDNGIIAFLLINPVAVRHTFHPLVGTGLDIDDIVFNYVVDENNKEITIKLAEDNKIIIGDKTINMVEIDDLIIRGYKADKYSLDIDQVMTNAERIIASLYHYGWLYPAEVYIGEDKMYYKKVKME